jgi:hypothetical protein
MKFWHDDLKGLRIRLSKYSILHFHQSSQPREQVWKLLLECTLYVYK